MKAACPSCGFTGELEAFCADADARRFIDRLLALPPSLHQPVRRYVALHRPSGRVLAWHRALRLLEELAAAVAAGSLRRKGRDWPAPVEAWVEAIDQVLARDEQGGLKRPLNGHGYLFEVLVGLADRSEGQAEAARERARQSPGAERHAATTTTPTAVAHLLDRAAVRAGCAALKDALIRPEPEPHGSDRP